MIAAHAAIPPATIRRPGARRAVFSQAAFVAAFLAAAAAAEAWPSRGARHLAALAAALALLAFATRAAADTAPQRHRRRAAARALSRGVTPGTPRGLASPPSCGRGVRCVPSRVRRA